MTEKQRFLIYTHLAGLIASTRQIYNVNIIDALKILLSNGVIQKLEDLETGYYLESDAYLEKALIDNICFIVNMLIHADYFSVMHSTIRVFDNRIVFQNPGRFDINISQWHKNAISKPRNPVIARIFRWAKLAENAGFGYDKMIAWKHKVEFNTDIDYSEAAFFLEDKVSDSVEKTVEAITPPITELERKFLDVIRQNPAGSRKEFAKELGISTEVVKEYTEKLKQKGILERKGNNRTGYWEIK